MSIPDAGAATSRRRCAGTIRLPERKATPSRCTTRTPLSGTGLNAGAGTPHNGDAPGDTEQPRNDFGDAGYSGPCPPPGKPHHYVFTVYALDVPELGIQAHFSRKAALAGIERHALAKATLTVVWGR